MDEVAHGPRGNAITLVKRFPDPKEAERAVPLGFEAASQVG
jgi:hypothetical protein